MGYIKDHRHETMMVDGDWQVGAYSYKAPRLLEEFVKGLKEKKIIGSMCNGCGKVITPPRYVCGRCHRKMDERQVVSNRGTIMSFVISPVMEKGKITIMNIDPVAAGAIKEGSIIIPVYVKFDGADSNIATELLNAKPEDAKVGMRVQAVWAEPTVGAFSDLLGVEPVKP